jgi:ABC-2 type transport system ATP-binding protein
MTELAIETRDLIRTYRMKRTTRQGEAVTIAALDGVSLDVPRGELFGLLGPNGAGKTTLIKVLATLLLPTSGTARVSGLDVVVHAQQVRERITMVSGGEHSGYGLLTVREQLWMFSQFYGLPSRQALARIDELLRVVGLYEERHRRVSALSTGMRQKMNVIRGLMTDPRVLFLDEPTASLDVGAARDVRREVRRWMGEDPARTVILTTHNMMEADELCDRVAIINRGRVIAEGVPASIRQQVQQNVVVDLQLGEGQGLLEALRRVEGVAGASVQEQDGTDRFSLLLADDAVLPRVLTLVEHSGRPVRGIQKREPTLEDAFVKLVGRGMAEEEVL